MTRADYELIAGVINTAYAPGQRTDHAVQQYRRQLVVKLGMALKEDNQNFDEAKFATACFDVRSWAQHKEDCS